MMKRCVFVLLLGMAAVALSSCDSGNRDTAPTGGSELLTGKNTATLQVQMYGFSWYPAKDGVDVAVNVVANGTPLGEIKINVHGKPEARSTEGSKSFTFAPRSGENVIELIGPSKGVHDKVALKCPVEPGAILVIRAFCVPPQNTGPGPRYTFTPSDPPDSPISKAALNAFNDGPPFVGISAAFTSRIALDKTLKHVEVKESPHISAPLGSPQVKRETYSVKHSARVLFRQKGETEANAKAFWGWGWAESRIKGEIEQDEEESYEETKTTDRTVTIPGDGKMYKMVWIEVYRTGRIEMTSVIDGQKQEVPFEFREGWDLQVREAQD